MTSDCYQQLQRQHPERRTCEAAGRKLSGLDPPVALQPRPHGVIAPSLEVPVVDFSEPGEAGIDETAEQIWENATARSSSGSRGLGKERRPRQRHCQLSPQQHRGRSP